MGWFLSQVFPLGNSGRLRRRLATVNQTHSPTPAPPPAPPTPAPPPALWPAPPLPTQTSSRPCAWPRRHGRVRHPTPPTESIECRPKPTRPRRRTRSPRASATTVLRPKPTGTWVRGYHHPSHSGQLVSDLVHRLPAAGFGAGTAPVGAGLDADTGIGTNASTLLSLMASGSLPSTFS